MPMFCIETAKFVQPQNQVEFDGLWEAEDGAMLLNPTKVKKSETKEKKRKETIKW